MTRYARLSYYYNMFILENWELREQKSMGLTNQLYLVACTLLHKCKQLSENVPDDIRALLIYLARSSYTLAMNSASSMSEMLRLRRVSALITMPPYILLEPGLNALRTAPLSAYTWLRGKTESVLSTD